MKLFNFHLFEFTLDALGEAEQLILSGGSMNAVASI